MAESYPNHLISIPRSLVSLKHYSQVHDQPFTRTLLFLVIVALVLTVLGLGVDVVSHFRAAERHQELLAEKLQVVSFQDGQASVDGEVPRVLWEYTGGADSRRRMLIVVLDTEAELETMADAAEAAGCPQSDRILFFGREEVRIFNREKKKEKDDEPPTYDYTNEEHLSTLRTLLEENGAALPEFKLVDGNARFPKLAEGKVHVLCQTRELTALVDATGGNGSMAQELQKAVEEDPELRERLIPPQFLLVVGKEGLRLKSLDNDTLEQIRYPELAEASREAVARWAAASIRHMRLSAALRFFLPYTLMNGLQLFILALICSVGGLVVNAVLKGDLIYGELLTMAVYATLPASVVSLIVAQLLPAVVGAAWALAVPVGVGLVYTGLAAARTVRPAGQEFESTI